MSKLCIFLWCKKGTFASTAGKFVIHIYWRSEISICDADVFVCRSHCFCCTCVSMLKVIFLMDACCCSEGDVCEAVRVLLFWRRCLWCNVLLCWKQCLWGTSVVMLEAVFVLHVCWYAETSVCGIASSYICCRLHNFANITIGVKGKLRWI